MYTDLYIQLGKLWELYLAIPLWQRVGGTFLAIVIIVDGAVLFFSICGGFSYLDKDTQSILLEESIQIINAAFSLICAIELPFRVRASYNWITHSIFYGSPLTEEDRLLPQSPYAQFLRMQYPWCIFHWNLFGMVTIGKVFQIFCQFGVEYLCLAYARLDQYKRRPSTLFTIFICFALPLGCIIGAVEGIYSNRVHSDKRTPNACDDGAKVFAKGNEGRLLSSEVVNNDMTEEVRV